MILTRQLRRRLEDALNRDVEYAHENDDLDSVESSQKVFDALMAVPDGLALVDDLSDADDTDDLAPIVRVTLALDFYGLI